MRDIIIVGAGPGGSATAKFLAERGYDVILYEKRQEIGAPKRCAEGISLGGLERLKLNPPANCIRQKINGARIYAPNGKFVEIDYGKDNGYILERKLFDKWLAEEAARKGAKIQAKTYIKEVLKEDGKIVGVKGEFIGKEFSEKCKVLVAADGIESKISKIAGLNTTCNPLLVDSGIQFEMTGIEIEDPKKIYLYFGNKIAPRGYCLTGDTEIIARHSIKPISEILNGEEVLTKEGWDKVKAISIREYKGKIVKITPFMINKDVKMTEDHLVYVWNKEKGFVWKKAKDLIKSEGGKHRNGDYLIFPILEEPILEEIDVSKYYKGGIIEKGYIYPKGRNQYGAEFKYKHKIPVKLKLTNELLELMGFFIAEGNTNSNGIILSNTDKELINKFAKIGEKAFGFRGSIWIQKRKGYKKCYQLQFASVILKKLFAKLFGVGNKNKKIPIEFLGLSEDKKKSLIKGLFLGDGYIEKSSEGLDKIGFTTTSKHLVYDVWMLLASINIVGAINLIKKKNAYRIRIRGKQIKKLKIFNKPLKTGNMGYRGFFIKDNKIFLGIRKLKKEYFKGKVYDIQTNGSFCPGFIVHNCWIFPKGKDVANVGIGIIGNSEVPAMDYLKKFIESKSELRKGSILEVNAGGIPVGGFLKKMTLDNFLVVGDAAHQVNPIHGGGIYEAQFAGRIAAEVIDEALQKGDTSEKQLNKYNIEWWKQRGIYLRKVEKLREVVEKLSDDDFNYLAENLTGEDLINFSRGRGLKTLGKLLIKRPNLIKFAKALF